MRVFKLVGTDCRESGSSTTVSGVTLAMLPRVRGTSDCGAHDTAAKMAVRQNPKSSRWATIVDHQVKGATVSSVALAPNFGGTPISFAPPGARLPSDRGPPSCSPSGDETLAEAGPLSHAIPPASGNSGSR